MAKTYIIDENNIINPNLLDNWYFVNPINQRGQLSYSGNTYTIDRWFSSNVRGVINITENSYISLLTDHTNTSFLRQKFEKALVPGHYTISILYRSSGTGYINIDDNTLNSSINKWFSSSKEWTLFSANVIIDKPDIYNIFTISNRNEPTDQYIDIKAVKLELGDHQTLAHQDSAGNWVLNEIPNYDLELIKCQRYFQMNESTNTLGNCISGYAVSLQLVTQMRILPSVNIIGAFINYEKVLDHTGLIRDAQSTTNNILIRDIDRTIFGANNAGKIVTIKYEASADL